MAPPTGPMTIETSAIPATHVRLLDRILSVCSAARGTRSSPFGQVFRSLVFMTSTTSASASTLAAFPVMVVCAFYVLVAHPGKGTYIYVAFALYRQLPELVPGAYRLLAALLSAGGRTDLK